MKGFIVGMIGASLVLIGVSVVGFEMDSHFVAGFALFGAGMLFCLGMTAFLQLEG